MMFRRCYKLQTILQEKTFYYALINLISLLQGEISSNGFGISEVAGGISQRSGEIPKGNFAYSVLCEVASVSERLAEPELFPKPLCRKGASDPTEA